jgi:hypothetical protein
MAATRIWPGLAWAGLGKDVESKDQSFPADIEKYLR